MLLLYPANQGRQFRAAFVRRFDMPYRVQWQQTLLPSNRKMRERYWAIEQDSRVV
jgi:hypothetical protein